MKRHIQRRHFGIHKYGCSICDFKVDLMKDLKEKHFIKEHPGQKAKVLDMFCNECVEGAEGHDHEFKKVKEHNEEFKCYECSLILKDFNAKFVHYKNVHPNHKMFSCEVESCSYKTNYLSCLDNHITVKHEKILQSCDLCTYESFSKMQTQRHMRKVHSNFPV